MPPATATFQAWIWEELITYMEIDGDIKGIIHVADDMGFQESVSVKECLECLNAKPIDHDLDNRMIAYRIDAPTSKYFNPKYIRGIPDYEPRPTPRVIFVTNKRV